MKQETKLEKKRRQAREWYARRVARMTPEEKEAAKQRNREKYQKRTEEKRFQYNHARNIKRANDPKLREQAREYSKQRRIKLKALKGEGSRE